MRDRRRHREVGVVDDVDVGTLADLETAAVVEPVEARVAQRLLVHDELER